MENFILTNIPLEDLAHKIAERVVILQSQNPPIPQKSEKEYFSVEELSEWINIATPTIYGLTHRNEIPFLKKGKKLYFKRTEIVEWLESGTTKTKDKLLEQPISLVKPRRKHS